MRIKTQICAALFCLTFSLGAQNSQVLTTATNRAVRTVSLADAVRMAVEHNLTIARTRFQPQISLYALNANYGYYDPVFSAQMGHNDTTTEPRLIAIPTATVTNIGGQVQVIQTFPLTNDLGSVSKSDSFNTGIGGYLPTGMRYDLTSVMTHQMGSQGPVSVVQVAGRPVVIPYEVPNDLWTGDMLLALRQPLLRDFWIDSARRNIQIAKKDLKIQENGLLLTIMQTINSVQQTYYDLIRFRETVVAREKAVELAQKFLAENRQRVRVGTMAPLDEKQAESEAALRLSDLIAARLDVVRTENLLKGMITDDFQQWYEVGIEPAEKLLALPQALDVQDSWLKALELRPDFRQAKLNLEKMGIQVKFAVNQLFPSLNLFGSYGRNAFDNSVVVAPTANTPPRVNVTQIQDASFSRALRDLRDENNPSYAYGVALSMPLSLTAERNQYKGAKAARDQAKIDVQQLHQTIVNNVDTAIKIAQASFEAVQASRAAREFAQLALDAEQKKYENGKSTPFVVLQLQRNLTNTRASEIDAIAAYNKALSELSYQEGTILDKNRINLQFK